MSDFRASRDALIAEVAERQYGVISTQQLRDAGLDKDQILHRVRIGRLHRIHHGVLAVGHARLSHRGRWMAGVLACGAEAVISHRSAASLWVTTPARTLADLKRIASARELRHAVRQADALGFSTGKDLAGDGTRSELEFLFLELCRDNFEADRARDLQLRTRGYEVNRLTYRQVTERPDEAASAVRYALTPTKARASFS